MVGRIELVSNLTEGKTIMAEMPTMNSNQQILQDFLLNITRQMALINLSDMEELLREIRHTLSMQDSIVVLVDPSRWMREKDDGTRRNIELQADILDHFIAIRHLTNQLQALSVEVAERNAESQRRALEAAERMRRKMDGS